MSIAIAPIGLPAPTTLEAPKTNETDFGGALGNALREADGLEKASQEASAKFAAGDQSMGIHEVMIASEKANIAVRYATTLRTKALEAYRELMNTQV